MSMTEGVFLCCLFVGGPAFGFASVYRSFGSPEDNRFHFVFGTFAAYAGWFVSGICAMGIHPDYPNGLADQIAVLYAIPGFVTGLAGVQFLRRFAAHHTARCAALRSTNERGMSLVEIMVVLMIIGLVTSLVGVAAYDAYEEAVRKETRIQLQKLQEGLALYRLTHRHLPSTAVGLRALAESGERQPPVMEKLPKDGWGREYVYVFPGNHGVGDYDLYSLGKNGIEGDDDDITSWSDDR